MATYTNRIDGQIWIDKKAPYRLKYHAADEDYTVEVATNYELPPDASPIFEQDGVRYYMLAGTVVKFNGRDRIVPAIFPDDIENVLGVVENDIKGVLVDGTEVLVPATVSRNSYLMIEYPQFVFANLGADYNDLNIYKNGWGDATSGIGAPVYWFIGRTVNNSGTYIHIDSAAKSPSTGKYLYAGKLTFATPSGFKWNISTVDDNSLNVGYDNLPQIGTVASYTVNPEDGTITKLEIHLNFAKFDTSLEWNWPYLHYNHSPFVPGDCGKLEPSISEQSQSTVSFDIHHGLFANANDADSLKARNYCDIIATNDPDSSTEYIIGTNVSNKYSGATDRKTTINVSTPDTLYYRVSGRVNYEFDKNHD